MRVKKSNFADYLSLLKISNIPVPANVVDLIKKKRIGKKKKENKK